MREGRIVLRDHDVTEAEPEDVLALLGPAAPGCHRLRISVDNIRTTPELWEWLAFAHPADLSRDVAGSLTPKPSHTPFAELVGMPRQVWLGLLDHLLDVVSQSPRTSDERGIADLLFVTATGPAGLQLAERFGHTLPHHWLALAATYTDGPARVGRYLGQQGVLEVHLGRDWVVHVWRRGILVVDDCFVVTRDRDDPTRGRGVRWAIGADGEPEVVDLVLPADVQPVGTTSVSDSVARDVASS